jgi:iron complex transport system substrate-binding protein
LAFEAKGRAGSLFPVLSRLAGVVVSGEDRTERGPMGRIGALVACLAIVVAACGGTSASPSASPNKAKDDVFPVTIHAANGDVAVANRPHSVVSLSPTATEMLFAIGAGDQVVAVDDQSDYPPEAPTTELSGYEPNVEAIAKYEPDLVVATSAGSLKPLSDLKISLLVQPAATSLNDSYRQLEQLGVATGHVAEAAEEVARIKSRIDEIVDSLPRFEGKPTYYHELDDTYFSVTSDTFIGQIYALVGLHNIADKADKAGTGYPQLSAEYIIHADPNFIFLGDSECCNQTPASVARRPGWHEISAVRNGAVIDVGDDISSRWGPRVVDLLQTVVDSISEVEPVG